MASPTTPTADDAQAIAQDVFGERPASCVRFTTGLRHWVYDVVLSDTGRNIVVRLSRPDHRRALAGGVFWHQQLEQVGVPVARVLASDVSAEQPYMVLERLAGTDIGNVIDVMSADEIRTAAHAVVEMQLNTAGLPLADGYGYALGYEDSLQTSWAKVLESSIERAQRWITAAGVVDPDWGRRVAELLHHRSDLVKNIEPIAFLHDATTKNVIVDQGRVTGLVDVDHMAFGDPLWAPTLTRMSLLAAQRPTGYADQQIEELSATSEAREHADLYTTLHCLAFLGELGQGFNQDQAAPVDTTYQKHLEAVLQSLI